MDRSVFRAQELGSHLPHPNSALAIQLVSLLEHFFF
jgi:hypothetical protein